MVAIKQFEFIDLFAGIGGMRLALENVGGQCVFSSEIDSYARKTYFSNFGSVPFGDITGISPKAIPDHDFLVAGFPCQPFSTGGMSTLRFLEKSDGFNYKNSGELFFEIARILQQKTPKMFLLENVGNLKSHDKGKTFRIIIEVLQEKYEVFSNLMGSDWAVPQRRNRYFIAGFVKPYKGKFQFPDPPPNKKPPVLKDILEHRVDPKYTLKPNTWKWLKGHREKHQNRGNGFGFSLVDPQTDNPTRTLSARYHKDGSEILIDQGEKLPRKLTPRECARLMGFEDKFTIPVSDTQAYRQFGNAVVVPVVENIAKAMIRDLEI